AVCYFFFFIQAEDGIRDFHVTGVQTCALPILDLHPAGAAVVDRPQDARGARGAAARLVGEDLVDLVAPPPGREAPDVRALPVAEIGRASCRERGWSAGGGQA